MYNSLGELQEVLGAVIDVNNAALKRFAEGVRLNPENLLNGLDEYLELIAQNRVYGAILRGHYGNDLNEVQKALTFEYLSFDMLEVEVQRARELNVVRELLRRL